MKRNLFVLFAMLMTTHFASADEPIRERIEWADIWVTDADKDDLPRVLLIGDSITRGYFSDVEKRLAGQGILCSAHDFQVCLRSLVLRRSSTSVEALQVRHHSLQQRPAWLGIQRRPISRRPLEVSCDRQGERRRCEVDLGYHDAGA